MKQHLLVGGDSFAEFPRGTTDPRTLARGSHDDPVRVWDGETRHWCEQWAASVGANSHSVGWGGADNTAAVNMVTRELMGATTYTHCVYFLTDPNRTYKRNTSHLTKGDRHFDKRDYVSRRWQVGFNWDHTEWSTAIEYPEDEMPVCIGNTAASLRFNSVHNKKSAPWEWIKYSMNLTPTPQPLQNTVAQIALLNSQCAARGIKFMVTSGFSWPRAFETWRDSECYPQFAKFDFQDQVRVNPKTGWQLRSHYTHSEHTQILNYLESLGLAEWLT